MDGVNRLDDVEGLSQAHHDFTVLPGGVTSFLVWTFEDDYSSDLVERAADGTLHTAVRIDHNLFSGATFHANSLHYHPSDDAYAALATPLDGFFTPGGRERP
jgi:hypothetical protein